MKLLLRREQKTELLGIMTFMLNVCAEFTREEQRNIDKYRLAPNASIAGWKSPSLARAFWASSLDWPSTP